MISLYQFPDAISTVKGIGPSTSEKLERLGITTIGDLIHHLPSRYIDFTKQVKISELKIKQTASFIAVLDKVKSFFTHSGKMLTQATAQDSTGKIKLTWFNNPYIKRLINEGEQYTIAGTPTMFGEALTLISPTIEEGDSFSLNTRGLVPVYPQTEGVNSKWLRKKIYQLLSESKVDDPVDPEIIKKFELLSLPEAYSQIHFPQDKKFRWKADKRLSFNEHLKINITNQIELLKLGKSVKIKTQEKIDKQTEKLLPFTLTPGQSKTVADIYKDLSKDSFTHRLIQGDTGSGKTATLIFAANQSLNQEFSCAIIAPTEILAKQHFQTFQKYSIKPKNVILITGSEKGEIDQNKPCVYIGTHSLINQLPKELKHPLSFLAIDEQHKFGVKQRDELLQRSPIPHLLNLSATPIPRTVALALLGDIEVSNIINKPINRLPTKTFVINKDRYKKSTDWLIKKMDEGNQIFVVCPNITEHDENIGSVDTIYKQYRKIFPSKYPIWSLHGQLKHEDQHKILQEFKESGTGILVATSLIEVGIDIPAANIMVIHSAEMFGLAQLHQLRGRVGRGEGQGYCFLIPSQEEETTIERLQLLQKYDSGLKLAQKDLRLRGAGEVFGIKQHGAIQTRLKYFWSKTLFQSAKKEAQKMVAQNIDFAASIATILSTC